MPLIDGARQLFRISGRLILFGHIVDVSKFLYLLLLLKFFNFFLLITEHLVFLVPDASEVKRLQALIVDISEFFETILILSLSHFDGVVSSFDMEVVLTRKLNRSLALVVVYENKDILVTKAA